MKKHLADMTVADLSAEHDRVDKHIADHHDKVSSGADVTDDIGPMFRWRQQIQEEAARRHVSQVRVKHRTPAAIASPT